MKTIKTNNCDIAIENSGFVYIEDLERKMQNLKNRLNVNTGEWFLDIGFGLNYSEIQGKGVKLAEIEQALHDCVTQDPEFTRIELIGVEINKKRQAKISFNAFSADDEQIYMEEVLAVG